MKHLNKYLHPYSKALLITHKMFCEMYVTTRAKVCSQNTTKCSANNYMNLIFILSVTSPKNLVEFYNELWNIRDRRVDDWFMMLM